MIRGVHTMFYSSQAEATRAFLRDKLGFRADRAYVAASFARGKASAGARALPSRTKDE